MPAPSFVAAGAVGDSVNAITPGLPAGIVADDILLLDIETAAAAISIANEAGGSWAEVPNSPQDAGGVTRLTRFWSRYNGTQTAPTTSDSGNHQYGVITAYRGCPPSGDPWDATAGTTFGASGDIFPGVTTLGPDRLLVMAATHDADGLTTGQFSGYTNANLSGLAERFDDSVSTGNGGGLCVVTGVKATPGATGDTTFTIAVGTDGGQHTIALKPATVGPEDGPWPVISVPAPPEPVVSVW